jgi:hypothetical protein
MIDETATLRKIKQFVTEEYNQISKKGAVIVKSVGNEYLVNDINVKLVDNLWQVLKGNTVIANLRQRRVAILLAALASKHYYRDLDKATVIDKQLDIYLSDKQIYSIRYKSNPDNQVYADRLARVENEINLLDQQLHELEKTVSLQ